MATLADQEFRTRLQALGDKFALTVPVTMARITEALADCRAGTAPDGADMPAAEALHALHELLHGVAGSAGTFGFGMLGQQCRRVEQQTRVVMTEQAGWPALAREVELLLAWAARDPRAETYGATS